MTEEKGYNGWANYETWCVKLWMDNNQGAQSYWAEAASDAGKHNASQLADRLRGEHEESIDEAIDSGSHADQWKGRFDLPGFARDLLNAALGEVDWYEIAESLLGDIEDEEYAEV